MWSKIFKLFKLPAQTSQSEPKPSQRYTANLAVAELGELLRNKFSHAKAGSTSFNTLFPSIVDAYTSLLEFNDRISSGAVISPTMIVFQKTPSTVSQFLTKDGYYLDISTVAFFQKEAALFLTSLEKSDTAQYGRDEYYGRILSHVFVALKDISNSLAACYK